MSSFLFTPYACEPHCVQLCRTSQPQARGQTYFKILYCAWRKAWGKLHFEIHGITREDCYASTPVYYDGVPPIAGLS
jgi:hypothetical protein